MTGFAERFIQQGIQQGVRQGIQQGVVQGIQRGEAKMLIRQLTQRFGTLPDETRIKIESADADTLLAWSERILTAETIEEIFTAS